jgi:hypothetical protein
MESPVTSVPKTEAGKAAPSSNRPTSWSLPIRLPRTTPEMSGSRMSMVATSGWSARNDRATRPAAEASDPGVPSGDMGLSELLRDDDS